MEALRRPPNTDVDTTPRAPGDLELVRAFLSLHDHVYGTRDSLPPSTDTIAWWFAARGLITPAEAPAEADLRWAGEVLEALRTRVHENLGADRDPAALRMLDEAARETGLSIHFGEGLRPSAGGIRGAVGRI